MSDTREQIAARVITDVSWTMDPHGFQIAAVHAAAGVGAGAKAVTDRVRAMHEPDEYGGAGPEGAEGSACVACAEDYPCPTVRLLDRIDAEMGVQR